MNGIQSFHIPDLLSENTEAIKEEREYKKKSISVTNERGKSIPFSVEELEVGKGMYVKVTDYKKTTYGSPYTLNVRYSTRDYVKHIFDWVLIEYPGLHEETEFEQYNKETDTHTQRIYNLNIVVDKNIPPLTKVFPTTFTSKNETERSIYSFSSDWRIGQPVSLEFGTEQVFKFELSLKTKKTDNIIPEKYSSTITALSTNIYELALPREFSENSQTVKIENISPTPTKLITNSEGNVVATFEVPANKESKIYVSGYIWLTQQPYNEKREIPNLVYKEYVEEVSDNQELSKYLLPTTYWETKDLFIQSEAEKLLLEKNSLMDVVKSDYEYIGEKFEYDQQKALDPNSQRLGAKTALQGGATVCMEYADTMITLLRAQGIPTRAAFGYTSLDTNSDEKISHQWVQIWIPEYGWLSVDPSYESTPMMIGQSIQYVLWDTQHNDDYVDIKAYSANNFKFDSSGYSVKVYAVSKDDIPNNLLSYSEIETENKGNSTTETLNLIMKTTSLGKALIIILPITVVLFLLIILFSLIFGLTRKARNRRDLTNQQP